MKPSMFLHQQKKKKKKRKEKGKIKKGMWKTTHIQSRKSKTDNDMSITSEAYGDV